MRPTNAPIIVYIVILFRLSFKKNRARIAVIKGIKLIVKTVLATVVIVIERIKQILAVPKNIPASNPDGPI